MSFIDTLREQEDETWSLLVFGGFDPDLHDAGVASATVHVSSWGRRELASVSLQQISISPRVKELAAAEVMVGTLAAHSDLFRAHHAIVEGEQLYPRDVSSLPRMVAVGNDLIYLAHVAGSALGLYLSHHCDAGIKRPAEWKGQRSKDSMREAIAMLLKTTEARVYHEGEAVSVAAALKVGSHGLDALGMALRCAGYKV